MVRADKFLVEKGLFESRNRASEAIRGGRVTIDGALENHQQDAQTHRR